MDRYVTPEPLPVPDLSGDEISRADLVFVGVAHRGESYEARVYLGNSDANLETGLDPDQGYAGSFVVFGHAGCFGDEGHCDPSLGYRDEFDVRPPHPLTPLTKTVIVTEALRRVEGDEVEVTIVAVDDSEEESKPSDELEFEELRLLVYSD
jgi:hypothetical protein